MSTRRNFKLKRNWCFESLTLDASDFPNIEGTPANYWTLPQMFENWQWNIENDSYFYLFVLNFEWQIWNTYHSKISMNLHNVNNILFG